jgi:hypothetical protein
MTWDKLKAFLTVVLFNVLKLAGSRKLLYVIVAGALVVAKAKFPEWSLPDADLVVDLVLALLACHTLTDVSSVVGVFLVEAAKAKRALPHK